jgi:hypothetical protein
MLGCAMTDAAPCCVHGGPTARAVGGGPVPAVETAAPPGGSVVSAFGCAFTAALADGPPFRPPRLAVPATGSAK